MPEEKQVQHVILKRDFFISSGWYGNRQFKAGEKLKVIPDQKEDFTKAGVSKAFVEKNLKFNKQI